MTLATKDAIAVFQAMHTVQNKITLKELSLSFHGSKARDVAAKGFTSLDKHCIGKKYFNKEIEASRFFHSLVALNVFKEKMRDPQDRSVIPY